MCICQKIIIKRINILEYCEIIGDLMHVINYTILDIEYTISKLSQFPSNLSIDH
jgi:hypothetical protein